MASINVVFIGVSGCGKSTVAALFARAAGARLVEADDFHPPASIARMSAGEPLTDEDRAGWLDAIADRIAQATARGEALVLACSALKRAYRDRLRRADPGLVFVLLDGSRELLAARIGARRGHFMPPGLLESQLATLERPDPREERCVTVSVDAPPEKIAAAAAAALRML